MMNAAAIRNAPPLSPVSIGGNEPSWASAYSPPRGVDNNKDGPYPNSRGNPISPPISGGSVGAMNGFPPGPRSNGGPSPPPSIGRSSQGTNVYARSESGRSVRGGGDDSEATLTEHYSVLKRFLGSTSQNGLPPPPNKARDKLQRLTTVQFLELSTDVYDELNRRFPPPNSDPPPNFLLPRDNFHPKRNQARQKLSSLPAPRFRDLATDVFCELERRIPRVAGGDIPRVNSSASMRMPSRAQTPVNGMNGYPPRNPSRVRRPSEASSVRSTALGSAYGIIPPSPGLPPPGSYDRPMAKQSQTNTIVPVKSTMVEEDDDLPLDQMSPDNGNGYGMNGQSRAMSDEPSSVMSEADRRQLDDYENQVRDLQAKVESLGTDLRKKEDELESVQDRERDSATRINVDKKTWDDERLDLENRLADAQDLNDRLKQELDRIRDDHAADTRQLMEEMEDLRQNGARGGGGDSELQKENDDLRRLLREQEQVTEEVQQEAQNLMREMRTLSQQSGAAWEKQSEMERTIEKLEAESEEWRSRYTKTKTQLRSLKATSMGLKVDQDAAKYLRDRGFTTESGLIKDFHVAKFQVAIDDLLQRARVDQPDNIMETMKVVVVSVRRIIKDMDDGSNGGEEQRKLKGRIASTANNLITAAKNFAASAGISPVSLVDAAASHLVAAVVELLKTVKIRPTPAGELEDDDDDDMMTPGNNSVGFFSPRSQAPTPLTTSRIPGEDNLPPPPPFRGFGNRLSTDSSAYSPVNSPRESTATDRFGGAGLGINGSNGNGNGNMNGNMNGDSNKALPSAPNGYGANGYGVMAPQRDNATEDLKIFLEDQTAYLVADIQELVAAIRSDAPIMTLRDEISRIAESVDKIVDETSRSSGGPNAFPNLKNLQACRERLLEAGDHGQELTDDGMGPPSREWRMWTQTLPPIAFEIARESKELVQAVDRLVMGSTGGDDFS